MIRFALAAAAALSLSAAAGSTAVKIQEVSSPGGLTAWLVEERSIPFVAIEINFVGGASLDLPGKRGATNLMTALLEEGAGDMDAVAFGAELEDLAASFEFGASDDGVSVSARFLTENRDAAVRLLREALVAPRFDAEAIERVRAQVLSGIASDETDPGDIAARAFDRIAFGDHPYASSHNGTEESVSALTRGDLVTAHRNVMVKDRVTIGASGDIGPEELADLLDVLLGDLPEGGAPLPDTADVDLSAGATVVEFDTPQSVALFGHAGISREDDDFLPAYVMSHILGESGFESRLMQEVRVERGLTYGIGAYLAPKDFGPLVVGQFSSGNDTMAEAVGVVRDEWRRMAEGGVTAGELEDAKTFLTGAYPLRFDGNSRIAGIMAGMQLSGLPIDYIETRNDKVRAVTLEDISRVARRVLRPESLHFVVVGRPTGLRTTN